jgi:hypothetical protein
MTHDEEQEPSRGFKVEDRRRFTESGESRRPEAATPEPPPVESVGGDAPQGFSLQEPPPAAEITFSTFILSLSTQVLAHLGEIPDPFTKQVNVDLSAARQVIDILGMLQDKTRGNLDAAEAKLIEGLLYDLRLRFVERSKR